MSDWSSDVCSSDLGQCGGTIACGTESPQIFNTVAVAVESCRRSGWRPVRRIGAVIFVTVGTQLPFPRLIEWIDAIAARNALDVLEPTAEPNGAYHQIRHQPFVTPQEYDGLIAGTRFIVDHDGLGHLTTATQKHPPLP